jgi:hypothetical protein
VEPEDIAIEPDGEVSPDAEEGAAFPEVCTLSDGAPLLGLGPDERKHPIHPKEQRKRRHEVPAAHVVRIPFSGRTPSDRSVVVAVLPSRSEKRRMTVIERVVDLHT